jgi:hypothetical protein
LFKAFRQMLLKYAVKHRPEGTAQNGVGSIWFDLGKYPLEPAIGGASSDSLIMKVLREHLAPAALGGKENMQRYAGGDWWFNLNYESTNPKEYHVDKSRPIKTSARPCPTPTVSTVFYVSGDANEIYPTVVFNQSMDDSAAPFIPAVPAAVAAVPARANRLVIFRGHALHGTLHAPASQSLSKSDPDSRRLVFVVNFYTLDR